MRQRQRVWARSVGYELMPDAQGLGARVVHGPGRAVETLPSLAVGSERRWLLAR